MVMIKKIILSSAFIIFGFGAVVVTTAPAIAEECGSRVATACDTQRVQDNRPDYDGALAVTSQEVVCLSVLATHASALVLAEGEVKAGEEVTGRLMTAWRAQAAAWKPAGQGLVMREICIPTRLLRGTMTLCNEENRSVWRSSDMAALRRMKRIPASDPACMLGKDACALMGL